MELNWVTPISCGRMWEPELDGVFVQRETGIWFYFKSLDRICLCQLVRQKSGAVQIAANVPRLALPEKWSCIDYSGDKLLIIDSQKALRLADNCLVDLSSSLCELYASQFTRSYVSETFNLGEYTISQRGNWGYTCQKNEEEIWRFTGKAYLYTNINRWNNRVFFGTAGFGGYFYILDVETGSPITAINTGGTRYVVHKDGFVYFLKNKEAHTLGELCCVDLLDGKIINTLSLQGTVTLHSKLQLIGDNLHAVTFNYSRGHLREAVLSCISI